MNIERLKLLRSIIADIPAERINIEHWMVPDDCGTVCCFAGWAACHPAMNEHGLTIDAISSITTEKAPRYGDYFGRSALRLFFDIDEAAVERLFLPGSYRADRDGPGLPSLPSRADLKRMFMRRLDLLIEGAP